MCNLYRMRSNAAEIARIFEADNLAGNVPDLAEIYPNQTAPVVRTTDGGRIIESFLWGFPPPGQIKRSVTNVRNLKSPFWLSALKRPDRRCLVPVTAFCEWTGAAGSKQKVWFDIPEEPLFAFAGIWRPVDGEASRFAFLTCEPNEIVGAIHPKAMPVLLTKEDASVWLTSTWENAEALVRPFASERMRTDTLSLF
ncbi:SOS response-associated peptidase [Pacificimonas flava]|uniref:SOS response-associated peptidase n=1 Tax=Pacificimonas flava TaxID=1234595 RepID=UPI000570B551|nr:SOS response-associated peptidase family protein [Pacificimonas flava]MBB5281858.1 putative SOS response-associated peptidase YedK [Pacificimonas flava]